MSTYLIGKFHYRIIKAKSATEAWVEYVTAKNGTFKIIWSREDARQKIIKMGYSKLSTTRLEDVYKLSS